MRPILSPAEELPPNEYDVELTASTGVGKVDDIVRGCIGLYETCLRGRVRSVYIIGSYVSGFHVSTSDIDLHVIFYSELQSEEHVQATKIARYCEQISPLEISVGLWGSPPCDTHIPLDCLLLYGENVIESMTIVPIEDQIRVYFNVDWIRRLRIWDIQTWPDEYPARVSDREERRILNAGALVYPLDYPDPEGEFYGYNQRRATSLKAEAEIGTKDLVNVLYSCILPLLSHRLSRHICNKEEAFTLYPKIMRDEWSEFLTEVWQVVRRQWEYRIPKRSDDRARLRQLCEQCLAFENHYLTEYRRFWIGQLQLEEYKWDYNYSDFKRHGLDMLTDVAFADHETEDGIANLGSEDQRLAEACKAALNRLMCVKAALGSV